LTVRAVDKCLDDCSGYLNLFKAVNWLDRQFPISPNDALMCIVLVLPELEAELFAQAWLARSVRDGPSPEWGSALAMMVEEVGISEAVPVPGVCSFWELALFNCPSRLWRAVAASVSRFAPPWQSLAGGTREFRSLSDVLHFLLPVLTGGDREAERRALLYIAHLFIFGGKPPGRTGRFRIVVDARMAHLRSLGVAAFPPKPGALISALQEMRLNGTSLRVLMKRFDKGIYSRATQLCISLHAFTDPESVRDLYRHFGVEGRAIALARGEWGDPPEELTSAATGKSPPPGWASHLWGPNIPPDAEL
jgi:hypothetical protein